MAAPRSLSLLALAFVALVALLSAPAQVNALVADRAQVARHAHAHGAIAKRKRGDPSSSGRCKPSPSSSPASSPPPTSAPAPTPTTSSPAPSTSSPAAPNPTSGTQKWGLAWSNGDQDLENFASLPNVGYLYTWSPGLPSTLGKYPNIEGISMLWGLDQTEEFQQTAVAGYARYAAGFNEPNEPSQSNIDPTYAAQLWQQYMNPLVDLGYHLISPACTDDAIGLTWYQQFFQACNGNCHVDSIAFHAYTTNAQDLITYATELHGNYSMDVWITEFADQNYSGSGGQPDMDDVWNFAGEVAQFVAATPWITAAFPFGAMQDLQGVDGNNALMTGDGEPTSLGYYYFG